MTALGGVALGVYAALCFHIMLPFETRVPGFSTFTVLKLLAFVLILVSLPRWRSLDFGRAAGRAAAALAPFVFLAGWLVAVSVAGPRAGFQPVAARREQTRVRCGAKDDTVSKIPPRLQFIIIDCYGLVSPHPQLVPFPRGLVNELLVELTAGLSG